ncbi:MAG: protein kinase, partial [Chloroflexota bacterium]
MSELVGQTIKGYEFLEHIGRGGFGAIYKAYQPILKREVAVKIILPQFANDPDFIRRFDVEAELIAQLEHPFIVPLYDYWRSPEGAYLVMRLLVEGSLRERMENEVIPPEEVVSIITNIADALHVAHRRNIVHRDVKPENILLDEDGRAYLTDFGIATLIEDDNKVNASDDTFSGSLIYAAPEQFTDSAITSQTDIYALGIILYELLMGSTPYNNKSITELVQAKLYEPVPDLEGTNEQYQARLNDIIARATASDIDNRYQSIRDFKVDIETALDTSSDVTQPIHLDQLQLQEPSSIFVSYSRDDEDFAQKLSRDLRSAGHTVWLDKSDIRGGEEWIKSITSGIANAYAFISIMSDSAQESRWVQREFLQAEEDGKPIFPVTASETNIPIYMKERHVLALYEDYEGNLETLLTELPDPPPVLNYAMTQESIVDLENPYKGLQAFQEYDSANFFGRDDLTKQLVERLSEKVELQRFLAVIGPSGSGKSSVVKAGLLPALRKGAVDNSDEWFYVEMFPGTQPFEELEAALLHVATESVPNLMDTLQSDARGLVRAVKQILPREGDSELLIVIDQFEEIFTLVEDEEQRQLFLYNLYQAVIDERSRIRLVVTLRADFYDKPLMYGGIGNMIRQRTEVVLPLSEAELEQTIVRPAEQAGAVFDPGLPQVIINDVMGQPGILPLLQYALTELFEQRKNRILSVKSYQKIGGVSGALAQRAEETYLEYDETFQKAVRQIFLRLVTLG